MISGRGRAGGGGQRGASGRDPAAQDSERGVEEELRDLLDREQRARAAISHDLHDLVSQPLVGARMLLENLRADLTAADQARVSRVVELVAEALSNVRGLARNLAVAAGGVLPFAEAARELAERHAGLYGIACDVVVSPDFVEPPAGQRFQALLVIQEAVVNAGRHGGCRKVEVHLEQEEGGYRVSILDDGKGIDEAAAKGGLGLATMRYRAGLLGGDLSVDRGPTGGTRVVLRWSTRGGAGG